MYDIVFLSYNEKNADQNWRYLSYRFPWAMRVHGVKGIANAHKRAADRASTNYFWVVDGDNVILDDFDFMFKWPQDDSHLDRVSVWRAKNPINGLIYGYGGVKLLPRKAVLEHDVAWIDFTTSLSPRFHPMPEVASITKFNSSPFDAWKGAFRECYKLKKNLITRGKTEENEARLNTWLTVANETEPFYDYALLGALAGTKYAYLITDSTLINDFAVLEQLYMNEVGLQE